MLGDATEDVNKRKPFEFLSSIFKRRREQDGSDTDSKPPDIQFEESNFYDPSWTKGEENGSLRQIHSPPPTHSTPSPIRSSLVIASATVGISLTTETTPSTVFTSSPSYAASYVNSRCTSPSVLSSCASPIIVHHTPIKSRDIGDDMEAIRLSRQDNPYLQRVDGSETSLIEEDILENDPVIEDKDTTQLVIQSATQDAALSITEVHEHLIRSPPPTSIPKTVTGKTIFVFPLEVESVSTAATLSNIKTQSLNPLISKGYENVLDHNFRQILDSQRKISHKDDRNQFSCSVPGTPAKQSISCKSKSHTRTHSEEAAIINTTDGFLAPVIPSGRRLQPSPIEVILTRPLQQLNPFMPPIKPLHKSLKPTNFSCSKSSGETVVSISSSGSSSSLTLPIRCPHQPASPKVT